MGFFDTVIFEAAQEECRITAGMFFQTYNLGRGCEWYSVSKDGKLTVVRPSGGKVKLKSSESTSVQTDCERAEVSFHGDLLLRNAGPMEPREIIARFTHGKLEWVKPSEDFPKLAELLNMISAG